VLVVPLETEFHWSRATISFAVGVNLLLYGAIGPFAAAIRPRASTTRAGDGKHSTTAIAGKAADMRISFSEQGLTQEA